MKILRCSKNKPAKKNKHKVDNSGNSRHYPGNSVHIMQTRSGKQNKFKAFTKQKKQDSEKGIGYAEKILPYSYEIKLPQDLGKIATIFSSTASTSRHNEKITAFCCSYRH